jgi:hypothetical protein
MHELSIIHITLLVFPCSFLRYVMSLIFAQVRLHCDNLGLRFSVSVYLSSCVLPAPTLSLSGGIGDECLQWRAPAACLLLGILIQMNSLCLSLT